MERSLTHLATISNAEKAFQNAIEGKSSQNWYQLSISYNNSSEPILVNKAICMPEHYCIVRDSHYTDGTTKQETIVGRLISTITGYLVPQQYLDGTKTPVPPLLVQAIEIIVNHMNLLQESKREL